MEPTNFETIFSSSNFFFSGYFRVPAEKTKSVFIYQNDSPKEETVAAIVFPTGGAPERREHVIRKTLSPGGSLALGTVEIEALLGGAREGSIFLCVKGPDFKDAVTLKDLMVNWNSPAGGSFFAIGPFSELNTPATKAKKSFFMFSPIVVSEALGSVNVLINHSSDPCYADAIEIIPTLANLNGEVIIGRPALIPPYGSLVIDTKGYFGDEGVALLAKTGGYGGLYARHAGHILVSYFFQTDQRGNIVCGNHTQPAIAAIMGAPTFQEALKGQIKMAVPWIPYLRDKLARRS
jgi:hypothetical protein